MSTFDKLKRDVEALEKGQLPARFSDRASAIKALEGEICGTAWRTSAEREKAQRLVHRLASLKWTDEATGRSSSGEPSES